MTTKSEEIWSKDEVVFTIANFKPLNAIFASVNVNQFKLISSCECARDVWIILQNAHEGMSLTKISKLQILPDLKI